MAQKTHLFLNTRTVDALPYAKAGRIDYSDTRVAGLTLRIGTKSKVWTFRYRFDGKRSRLVIGRAGDVSEANARAKATEYEEMIRQGRNPAIVTAKIQERTVLWLVGEYINKHAKPNKRSWKEDKRILDRELVPVLGSRLIGDVSRRDLLDIRDAAIERGAPVAANRTLSALSKLFRWAVSEDYMSSSPAYGIKKPHKEAPRKRALNEDEIAKVWHALPGLPVTDVMRRIIRLCLLTGQRQGEIAGMRLGEIDLNERVWLVPEARTKNKQDHLVPLSDAAMVEVTSAIADVKKFGEAPKDDTPLFAAVKGRPVLNAAVSKAVKRNQDKFGIDPWTPHDLRRTMITHFSRLGISRSVASYVVNHGKNEGGVTGRIYDQWEFLPEKRRALNAWASEVMRIIKGATLPSNVSRLKTNA
jgi:integrase